MVLVGQAMVDSDRFLLQLGPGMVDEDRSSHSVRRPGRPLSGGCLPSLVGGMSDVFFSSEMYPSDSKSDLEWNGL